MAVSKSTALGNEARMSTRPIMEKGNQRSRWQCRPSWADGALPNATDAISIGIMLTLAPAKYVDY
jgi:hypothetical protein